MNDVNNLATFLSDGWLHIMQGISKSDAPARFPTFATVAPNGEPEARTVALRHADRKSNIIEVYTDITTPKVTSLRKTPLAAVHVFDNFVGALKTNERAFSVLFPFGD